MATHVLSLRPRRPLSRSLAALAETFSLHVDETCGAFSLSDRQITGITGITMATAEVQSGDVFVGLPGKRSHGASYARVARDAGAVAIITDQAGAAQVAEREQDFGIPVLVAPNVREILGELAAWVYRTGEEAPLTFGVTGTNGKTSVVYLLSALLEQLGVKSGLSSTAERRIGEVATVSQLTTPEATELHALLARMKEESVQAVAIEVSAQALTHHRVDGIFFDVAGFANLSHDHLDDYESFDTYFAAKADLFSLERAARGVVTVDTPWGVTLAAEAKIPITTLSTDSAADPAISADWHVIITEETPRRTSFTLTSREGAHASVSVPLLGRFMAANAALAIVMLVEGGYPLSDITAALERDGGINVFIPGRAEIVSGATGPIFYVDYGHTPDAFDSILMSLRKVIGGKIVMVFGADGDRDATKREEMGRLAAQGADTVVITDFHPRTEDPAAIRAQLLAGARSAAAPSELFEVSDPTEAVRFALTLVGEGDAILYAGPGHENYREVAGQHVAYDARNDVRLALCEAGWMDKVDEE
jgi:UDP-N-acetylmuramoyl-L-alanyl-D-glutamate--2,6-diaminopimelate ligase